MLSFARLTSFVLFVLSLSFLTCATSTPKAAELTIRDYGYGNGAECPSQTVMKVLVDLQAKVEVAVSGFDSCDTIAKVGGIVDVLVVDVTAAAGAILAVGTKISVDAEVTAKIAAQFCAIIQIIIKACADLTIKFGLAAMLTILAKIDACVHLLLINLDICIEGIIAICVKLLVNVDAKVFIQANLHLCATLLALISA